MIPQHWPRLALPVDIFTILLVAFLYYVINNQTSALHPSVEDLFPLNTPF